MVKTPSSDKLSKQKVVWDDEDDERIQPYASKQRAAGIIRRCGKSGRKKGSDEQKPDPRHKNFSPEEEELVIKLHAAIGSRWPIIAQQIPGRTENDVKILWNSKLRKKLAAMGIDPVTHKPFSQILTDYGNIGAFPRARTRFTSLSRHPSVHSETEHQSQLSFPNTYDNGFRPSNTMSGPDPQHSFDLYSQLQAVNLVTETSNSNYPLNSVQQQCLTAECGSFSDHSPTSMMNEEMSSFSWSDFLLEDAFQPPNIEEQGVLLQCGENVQEKLSPTSVGDKNCDFYDSFELGSSSSNSTFMETMLENQDEMFPHFPHDLYEEVPFYL